MMRLLTYNPAGDGPGGDVNALLHESSQREPEAVDHAEVVAHLKHITLSLLFDKQFFICFTSRRLLPLFLTLTPRSATRTEKT